MTQEIIVYRNPLEAAMWDSLMNGDGIVIIIGIAIAAMFCMVVMTTLEPLLRRTRWRYQELMYMTAGGITFFAVTWAWVKYVII